VIDMTSSNKLGGINGNEAPDGLTKPVRDDFLRHINAAHEAVQKAESLTLDSAMKAGCWLRTVKVQISIPMQDWMARYLPGIGVSTYKLYLQLTAPANWAKIMAARETDPLLSINAARKLIAKKKPASPEPSTNPAEAGTGAAVITDEQLIAALAARGPDWMLENMPGWRDWLVARLRGVVLRAEQAKHPDTKMKNIRIPSTPPHLKLVYSAGPPTQH
jgi:hypothetical protein